MPRIMPPEYKAPDNSVSELTLGEMKLKYKLNSAGLVDYQVYDPYEGTVDNHICTVNQFECAISAACDDDELSTSEYEEAERAQGPIVRWIP